MMGKAFMVSDPVPDEEMDAAGEVVMIIRLSWR
jgi:DNA-directed RNA polymerase subunit H (RpoH/RPB5)